MNLVGDADFAGSGRPTLFESALDDQWARLPAEIRELHAVNDVARCSGTATVTRGRSLVARLASRLFGLPADADAVPLTVTMTRTARGERWDRDFGGRVMHSHLTRAGVAHRVRERFGPFTYELALQVEPEALRMSVCRGWFLGLRLPYRLLSASDGREYVRDGTFHFDVTLREPLRGGLIVRYRGWLRRDPGRDD